MRASLAALVVLWLAIATTALADFSVVDNRDAAMYVDGNVLYVGIRNELMVVDTKNLDNIVASRVLTVSGRISDIARFQGYLAVSAVGGGVTLLDTINQLRPFRVDTFNDFPNVYAVEAYGDFALLALGNGGLALVEFDSEKRKINRRKEDPVFGHAFDMALSDEALFVAGGIDGLSRHFIDRNGYRVAEKSIGDRRTVNRVVVDGPTGADFSREAVDVFPLIQGSGRTATKPLRDDWIRGTIRGGSLSGSVLAVIPDNSTEIYFFDLADPEKPRRLAQFRANDEIIGAVQVGPYWAVLTAFRKLMLLELDDSGRVAVVAEEGI